MDYFVYSETSAHWSVVKFPAVTVPIKIEYKDEDNFFDNYCRNCEHNSYNLKCPSIDDYDIPEKIIGDCKLQHSDSYAIKNILDCIEKGIYEKLDKAEGDLIKYLEDFENFERLQLRFNHDDSKRPEIYSYVIDKEILSYLVDHSMCHSRGINQLLKIKDLYKFKDEVQAYYDDLCEHESKICPGGLYTFRDGECFLEDVVAEQMNENVVTYDLRMHDCYFVYRYGNIYLAIEDTETGEFYPYRLLNIYRDGEICLGKSSINKSDPQEVISAYLTRTHNNDLGDFIDLDEMLGYLDYRHKKPINKVNPLNDCVKELLNKMKEELNAV